jgi:hypothetical protein
MRTTLDIGAGINTDETLTAVGANAWSDGDRVRFLDGRWETIGGWERLVSTLLSGVCRTALAWTDNLGALIAAFGTHLALQVYRGGVVYTVTPTKGRPPPQPQGEPASGDQRLGGGNREPQGARIHDRRQHCSERRCGSRRHHAERYLPDHGDGA